MCSLDVESLSKREAMRAMNKCVISIRNDEASSLLFAHTISFSDTLSITSLFDFTASYVYMSM